MKKVLSVIGGFFASIWRWIKETAWVQPLLIVGIIFGIIFAIPSVVDGIRAIDEKNNSAETYYKKFLVSMKGAEKSDADKLLAEIKDNAEGRSTTLSGQKFFLLFVNKDCPYCKEAREGFEYLTNEGKSLIEDGKFEIKTIFTDEDSDWKKRDQEDWKKEDTIKDDNYAKSAIDAFLIRNASYFEGFAGDAQETDFYLNDYNNEQYTNYLDQLETAEKIPTPTIIQVDFARENGTKGVTNIFFGINAEENTKLSRAQYIADAWNYKGMFGPQ